ACGRRTGTLAHAGHVPRRARLVPLTWIGVGAVRRQHLRGGGAALRRYAPRPRRGHRPARAGGTTPLPDTADPLAHHARAPRPRHGVAVFRPALSPGCAAGAAWHRGARWRRAARGPVRRPALSAARRPDRRRRADPFARAPPVPRRLGGGDAGPASSS